MANVTTKELGSVIRNVLASNSNLVDEAKRLGVSEDELISFGDKMYIGKSIEYKWKKVKRLSKKRVKKREKTSGSINYDDSGSYLKNKVNSKTYFETNESDVIEPKDYVLDFSCIDAKITDNPEFNPKITETHCSKIYDSKVEIEELIQREDELKRKLATKLVELESAEQISVLRNQAVVDSREILEKAKLAWGQAQKAFDEAQKNLVEKQDEVKQTKEHLDKIQDEIKDIKINTIYLVDPWYKGDIPEYGKFVSTSEVDGLSTTVEQVEAIYMPKDSVEGILLFDYVPDYKKARAFVGLITKYMVENKLFKKLISDTRVSSLIEMSMK